MSLRIVIADTYYDRFLDTLYRREPNLAMRDYDVQHRRLMDEHFCTSDAYARAFKAMGCEAWTLVLNARPLQHQWSREHDFTPHDPQHGWPRSVFIEQVRRLEPDVVFMQQLSVADDETVGEVGLHARLVAGQIACSVPRDRRFDYHDLMVSSWPPLVEYFLRQGKPATYLPLAFDESVLPELEPGAAREGVSFVGGLSGVHEDRIGLLEALCGELPVDVFGYGVETLAADSPIRRCHRGEAWGVQMYRRLASSAVTVNCHGTISVRGLAEETWANNCRLFEATGVGTCLVTDHKRNLADLFVPGIDVATYASPSQCIDVVGGLLADPARRDRIAAAGARTTHARHTYRRRAEALLERFECAIPGHALAL